MATGTRLRYNLTSGTLGSSLGVSGTPAGFLLETGLTGGSGTDDEYGNALTVNETNVVATGLRIYYPQTRSVTCRLWRDSDQTLLDSVVISATANTWSTANFSTEVPLTNGATYVVSVGHVSGNVNFRSDTPPSTNGATHLTWVEGRYSTAGAGLFPATANANTPYGLVDLLAYTGTPNISIDFGANPGFATIGAGEYIPLTVGDSEIVHLTSYTSGNTSGTVERGQEGTTALTHASGAAWVHGPTTQDFDVTELDQYDTLATQSDIAGFLSEQPSGLVHTDAAADPLDGTGTAGDFHLRRDTGLLTGPKIEQTYETLYHNDFQSGGTATLGSNAEAGTVFSIDAADADIIGVRFPTGAYDWTGHTVRLWSGASVVKTATVSVTAGGWAIAYFSTPYAATNGNEYTVSFTRISNRDYVHQPFSDAGSALVTFVNAVYNLTGGNRPTTVVSPNTYGVDPLVDAPGVAEASTWTNADTRTLGDVVQADIADMATQADIAGFLTEVDGGTVHTDAAADPDDGTGVAGDFHLRSDTGTLTGPKLQTTVPYRSSSTSEPFASAWVFNKGRGAFKFTMTSDLTVNALDMGFEDTTGGQTVTLHLLNADRTIIESTVSGTNTTAGYYIGPLDLNSPVELVNGTTYWIAYDASAGTIDIPNATFDAPDGVFTTAGDADDSVLWNATGSTFTSAPNDSYSSDFMPFKLISNSGDTWTGADTRILGDVVQSDIADMATLALTVSDEAGATYTVVAGDTGTVKRFTASCTIDLPTGLAVGTVVELMAFHASGITVQAGSGATVHGGGTVAQYKTCSALCVATDTWVVTGAS